MIQAVRLRTEYLENPLGIDVQNPGLMWNVEGAVRQTAYRILAQTEGETIWDSGKTASSRMTGIRFPHMLASRQRVLWKVKLWDENDGAGDWSEEAFFEMGLLEPMDWGAKWITGNYREGQLLHYVYSSLICNSQKLETTQMSLN